MKIKYIIYYITFAFLVSSCASSSKLLQKGEYDKAIVKAAKILQKKPDKTNEINTLKKAYTLANNNDIDAIRQLKMSGQPDIFDKVVMYYNRLVHRQEIVERLPDQVLNAIGFSYSDYSNELIKSKKKAAEFFYAHALSLLKTGDKMDARQAYNEFARVKDYFPVYLDVDNKMNEAYVSGTNNIIFIINNDSRTVLPEDFESELLKISLKKLNRQWLNFDTYIDENIDYDYSVFLTLRKIATSPERIKEAHYKETKEIEDGFDYLLDENGNVKKDSAGNDIKVPKIRIISCHVTETQLHKSALVNGTLDFYDNTTNQLIKTQPIASEFIFDYRFATATGNLVALKKETKKIIGLKPVPFPTDLQMIFDTNEDLKSKAKSTISANRKILLY